MYRILDTRNSFAVQSASVLCNAAAQLRPFFFRAGEKAQTVVSILKSSQNWVNLAFSKLGQNVFLVIVLVLIFMLVRAIIPLPVRNYAAFEAEFLKVSKKKLIYFRSNIIFF